MNKRVTVWEWEDIRELAYDLYGQILPENVCKDFIKLLNKLNSIENPTCYYTVSQTLRDYLRHKGII